MDEKTLEALAKEERTRYYREWRKKNPDKVKKHNRNYWKKRVEEKLKRENPATVEKAPSNDGNQDGDRKEDD